MIFLTVGSQFPFERLVKAMDELIGRGEIMEKVFAQIGKGAYIPHNFEAVESLRKWQFDKYIRESSAIISHAGVGTISAALSNNKPLLVMPRQKKYGEVVSGHQAAIAERFEELGHILVAQEVWDLPAKIKALKFFVPRPFSHNRAVMVNRIAQFLNCVGPAL